jgi:hypothetical protein
MSRSVVFSETLQLQTSQWQCVDTRWCSGFFAKQLSNSDMREAHSFKQPADVNRLKLGIPDGRTFEARCYSRDGSLDEPVDNCNVEVSLRVDVLKTKERDVCDSDFGSH